MSLSTAARPSRVSALKKLQAAVFGHSYNPDNTRTGSKILRERLRGPTVASYYPPRTYSIKIMSKLFPSWETYDERESDRFDSLALKKARGKGAPKKKRTAEEGKKKKPGKR